MTQIRLVASGLASLFRVVRGLDFPLDAGTKSLVCGVVGPENATQDFSPELGYESWGTSESPCVGSGVLLSRGMQRFPPELKQQCHASCSLIMESVAFPEAFSQAVPCHRVRVNRRESRGSMENSSSGLTVHLWDSESWTTLEFPSPFLWRGLILRCDERPILSQQSSERILYWSQHERKRAALDVETSCFPSSGDWCREL